MDQDKIRLVYPDHRDAVEKGHVPEVERGVEQGERRERVQHRAVRGGAAVRRGGGGGRITGAVRGGRGALRYRGGARVDVGLAGGGGRAGVAGGAVEGGGAGDRSRAARVGGDGSRDRDSGVAVSRHSQSDDDLRLGKIGVRDDGEMAVATHRGDGAGGGDGDHVGGDHDVVALLVLDEADGVGLGDSGMGVASHDGQILRDGSGGGGELDVLLIMRGGGVLDADGSDVAIHSVAHQARDSMVWRIGQKSAQYWGLGAKYMSKSKDLCEVRDETAQFECQVTRSTMKGKLQSVDKARRKEVQLTQDERADASEADGQRSDEHLDALHGVSITEFLERKRVGAVIASILFAKARF
ncbi:hypothetical protein PG995_010631 [Apiospora arundinis]